MFKILIFGGTFEGRMLAEFCSKNHIHAFISVTSEYGSQLIEELNCLHVLVGKMDCSSICEFISENCIETVIDATHPYAEEATRNIKNACNLLSVKYMRIVRDQEKVIADARYFDDINALVNYLNMTNGNILITTGSKNIIKFCNIENYSKRCVIRVLPITEIVEQCVEFGYDRSKIITEKGPFSLERNDDHINRFNIKFIVTKDSGSIGGFIEKIVAAQKNHTEILIIKRPEEIGISLDEAQKILTEKYHE